jgi:type I restriction enzyme S subunit
MSTYAYQKKKINAIYADNNMWQLDLENIEKGGKLLTKKTVGELKAKGDKVCFEKGDILYSKLRPYLLKVLIAADDGICTPEIVPFKLYGKINAEYIVYLLKSPYIDSLVNSKTYGVKMPRVGTETMINILIPLPPITEQKRIVSQITKVLSYCDKL